MTIPSNVLCINLSIHPQFPPGNDIVESLLDAFETSRIFMPTHWGRNEQMSIGYKRKELLAHANNNSTQSPVFFLARKLVAKYSGYCSLGKFPFVSFDFHKSLSARNWPDLLCLADRLAASTRVRFGILHIFRPTADPWVTEKDRILQWIEFCAQPIPVRFSPNGPLGLGMRTYFGQDILDMFGRNLLVKTPADVRDLGPQGICIDLAKDLWNLSQEDLLKSWQKAMDYLAPSHAFAEPVFHEDHRSVDFKPSPSWRRHKGTE